MAFSILLSQSQEYQETPFLACLETGGLKNVVHVQISDRWVIRYPTTSASQLSGFKES